MPLVPRRREGRRRSITGNAWTGVARGRMGRGEATRAAFRESSRVSSTSGHLQSVNLQNSCWFSPGRSHRSHGSGTGWRGPTRLRPRPPSRRHQCDPSELSPVLLCQVTYVSDFGRGDPVDGRAESARRRRHASARGSELIFGLYSPFSARLCASIDHALMKVQVILWNHLRGFPPPGHGAGRARRGVDFRQ